MKRTTRTALVLAVASLAFVGSSHAVCKNARIVSALFPTGSYSYIYTPGVTPSATSSSITDDFEGFFWALGAGGPEFHQGHDSGAFVAMGEGRDGWFQHAAGYPATFHTTWGAGRHIDGCIDQVDIKATCTVVMLSDEYAGKGYFALLTAVPVQGNYSFVQPENGPITLAPVPAPQVIDTRATPSDVQATVRVDGPSGGLFLDPGCPAAVVRGYRIYAQVVEQGAGAPLNRRLPSSSTGGDWVLADSGEAATGAPSALGATSQVTVSCAPNDNVYLVASLIFDSGFETRYVSDSTGPIRCTD